PWASAIAHCFTRSRPSGWNVPNVRRLLPWSQAVELSRNEIRFAFRRFRSGPGAAQVIRCHSATPAAVDHGAFLLPGRGRVYWGPLSTPSLRFTGHHPRRAATSPGTVRHTERDLRSAIQAGQPHTADSQPDAAAAAH